MLGRRPPTGSHSREPPRPSASSLRDSVLLCLGTWGMWTRSRRNSCGDLDSYIENRHRYHRRRPELSEKPSFLVPFTYKLSTIWALLYHYVLDQAWVCSTKIFNCFNIKVHALNFLLRTNDIKQYIVITWNNIVCNNIFTIISFPLTNLGFSKVILIIWKNSIFLLSVFTADYQCFSLFESSKHIFKL